MTGNTISPNSISVAYVASLSPRFPIVGRQTMPTPRSLVVGDTLAALQQLAARHRQRFTIPVVGITGSNGKTMVKEWLYQTLSKDHVVTRSPRSYNSQVGVPLSLWLLDAQTQGGRLRGRYQPARRDAGPPRHHPSHAWRAHHDRRGPSGKLPFDRGQMLRRSCASSRARRPWSIPRTTHSWPVVWQSQAIRASTLAGRVKMLPQPSMSCRRRNCLPIRPSATVGRETWREATRCLSSMRPHSKTPSP